MKSKRIIASIVAASVLTAISLEQSSAFVNGSITLNTVEVTDKMSA